MQPVSTFEQITLLVESKPDATKKDLSDLIKKWLNEQASPIQPIYAQRVLTVLQSKNLFPELLNRVQPKIHPLFLNNQGKRMTQTLVLCSVNEQFHPYIERFFNKKPLFESPPQKLFLQEFWREVRNLAECRQLSDTLEENLFSQIDLEIASELLTHGKNKKVCEQVCDWANRTLEGSTCSLHPVYCTMQLTITTSSHNNFTNACGKLLFSDYKVFQQFLQEQTVYENVRVLELDFPEKLQESEIDALRQYFPSLVILNIHSSAIVDLSNTVNGSEIELVIIKNCNSIQALDLHLWQQAAVLFVGDTVPDHTEFATTIYKRQVCFAPKLIPENTTCIYNIREKFSDYQLLGLCEYATSIHELHLIDCYEQTKSVLGVLSRFPELKALSVDCISDESLHLIAKHCKNLEYLDISSSEITDVGLIGMIRNCTKLTSLFVNECPLLTDHSILQFLHHHHTVEILDISNCPELTDAVISYIIDEDIQIEHLIVDSVQFDPELLDTLIETRSIKITQTDLLPAN